MRWIRIRHPVTGGEAKIAQSALGAHVAAGWVAVDEETPAALPLTEPAGAAHEPPGDGNATKTSRSRAGGKTSTGE